MVIEDALPMVFELLGLAAVVVGVALIYAPAAWIVAGLLIIGVIEHMGAGARLEAAGMRATERAAKGKSA